ncbi:outer membrane beta-barrel protein [Vibrio metschnikovii]|uniref:outer membrane beta-barrel protein n=1 Tax=Vibrio metschnikovii TaxID=28172 RepID=UPI002FCBC21B
MNKLALPKLALALLLGSSCANANIISGVAGVGYGFGGEKIFEGLYDNGKTDDVKSNEGISIFGGVDINLINNFILRGTVGYKFDAIFASNGEVSFNRVPLELIVFKGFNNHKIGAGITHQKNVKFECNVKGICGDIEFDDATGFVAQYEYAFSPAKMSKNHFAIGVKYTHIEYTTPIINKDIDGSGFDVHLAYLF